MIKALLLKLLLLFYSPALALCSNELGQIPLTAGAAPYHVTVNKGGDCAPVPPSQVTWTLSGTAAAAITITADQTGFNFTVAPGTATSTATAKACIGTQCDNYTVVVTSAGPPTPTAISFTSATVGALGACNLPPPNASYMVLPSVGVADCAPGNVLLFTATVTMSDGSLCLNNCTLTVGSSTISQAPCYSVYCTAGNVGIVQAGPLTFGAFGANFNGTQYIDNATLPVTSSALTVSVWFNSTNLSNGNPRLIANSHTDVDVKGFQLMFSSGGASGLFDVGNGTTEGRASWSQQLAVNTWYNYVGVYDGASVKAYINGVQVASTAFAGGPIAAGTGPDINIARNPTYGGDYFVGAISDARIYNRALSAAEVLALYNAGQQPPATKPFGLEAEWPLSQSSVVGAVANDVSGFDLNIVTSRQLVSTDDGPHTALVVAGNVSASLPGPPSVVSAGTAIPAQAAAAGFTAQILKADFTQTTGPWSNAANFMTNCGAANSVPGQPSTWHFTYNIWPNGPSLPCDHASIAIDPDFGNRALLLRMTPSDYATNNNSNQGDDLMFPDYVGHNTGVNTWVPMEQYVKIVWREPASSYNMGGTCGNISCYGSGVSAPWSAPMSFSSQNLDWSEIGGYTSLSTLYFFQTIGNYSGGEVDSPPGQDVTQYKTIEGLSTSDGSTVLALCLWVDGRWSGCLRGFSNTYTVRDYITLVALNINRGPNDPQTMPNELDVYIKSLEWWSCPNYLTANCVGTGFPVIDHWPFP